MWLKQYYINLGEMNENGQLKIVENVNELCDIWKICKNCRYHIILNMYIYSKLKIYLKSMTIGRKLDILQDAVTSFI